MRIGVAGVGRIGALHAATLRSVPAVRDLVVADADADRGKAVAAELCAEYAADTDALLASGLDGIVIATATSSHAELITASVRAGVPVFCEKPVAGDVAGSRAVCDAVDAADVPVQVGFQRRFDRPYAALRVAVASGRLGFVHTLRATTLDPGPPPAAYIRTSGGIFRDCSVHDFDIIRWVTGREVIEVVARGTNHGAPFFADAGDVDSAAAMLTLDDRSFALVSATRYNGAGYDVRLEVLGERGSIAAGLDDRVPLASADSRVSFPPCPAWTGFLQRFAAAYVAELTAFTEVVAGTREVPCTVHDGLEAFLIAEACERSRASGLAVPMAQVRGR
ncbi:MAG: Gfo/Idh/MocA family protein [Mycobacteriales bacterium]